MKKILWVLAAMALISVESKGQFVHSDTIQFSTLNENQADTAFFWVRNVGALDMNLAGITPVYRYSLGQFQTILPGSPIPVGDSAQVGIIFSPAHNVLHKVPMIVRLGNKLGYELLSFKGQGQWSQTYYSSTENKSEQNLRAALTVRLGQGYTSLSYTTARDNMYGSLDNHNGQVTCVYTGRSATFNTRAGANANNINCEHTFPQSKFNSAQPMKADIHHLFPSDASANSSRSNHPFGVVVGTPDWSNGGSKRKGSLFEPRDVHKGDAARAMLYFVARYGDYQNFFAPQEPILTQWHEDFPPDSLDRLRNQGIYNLQYNRNPFIDYPQITERVSDWVGTSPSNPQAEMHWSEDTLLCGTGMSMTGMRHLIIVNTGLADLVLNNWQFSSSSVSVNPSGTMTIPPGEARTIEVHYDLAINYNGQSFSVQTNDPNLSSKTWYMKTTNAFGLEEGTPVPVLKWRAKQQQLEVWPVKEGAEVSVYDASGRLVQKGRATSEATEDQPLMIRGDMPRAGVIHIEHQSGPQSVKFVINQ